MKTQAILQHRSKKGQSAFRSAAHLSKGALGPAVDIRFVACCRWHKGHFRRIEGIGDEAGPCAKPIEKRRIPLSVKLDTFTMSAQCRLVFLYGRPTNGMW